MAAKNKSKQPVTRVKAGMSKVGAFGKIEGKIKRGGRRPGSGRKKGSRNKKTAAVIKAVTESGVMPLDYMLDVMRAPIPEEAEPAVKVAMHGLRFEAAKAAAPYVHPKLSAIEHTGKDGNPLFGNVSIHVVGIEPRR